MYLLHEIFPNLRWSTHRQAVEYHIQLSEDYIPVLMYASGTVATLQEVLRVVYLLTGGLNVKKL